MAGECIVARVMRRNGHDGSGSVACKHVIADPYRYLLARQRVDGIAACPDSRHLFLYLTFAFGLVAHLFEVSPDRFLLSGRGQHGDIFRLRSEHHEGDSEDGVGTRGENLEAEVLPGHGETHLGAFRPAYPVALGLLERVAPLEPVESVEQTLCVCRHPQTPLFHNFLFHRETSAHAHSLAHFIVGEHSAESRTPVHHRLAEIGYAVVHKPLGALFLREGVPFFGGEG